MAFEFESAGRDWAISITDLILALVAFWASSNVSGKQLTLDLTSETNLIGISYATLGLCALLGFIRWGFIQNNKLLNQCYGHLIDITKFGSIPFLVTNLITQTYVTKSMLFITFHMLWLLTRIFQFDRNYVKNLSQIVTIVPIILLLIQGILETNYLKIAVVIGFLMVPIATDKSGVPLMHIVLCVVVWLLESARVGSIIRSF